MPRNSAVATTISAAPRESCAGGWEGKNFGHLAATCNASHHIYRVAEHAPAQHGMGHMCDAIVDQEPLMVPIAEAARLSGLSRSELYRRLAAGDILARKAGTRTLVVMATLRAHVASLPRAVFRAPHATR